MSLRGSNFLLASIYKYSAPHSAGFARFAQVIAGLFADACNDNYHGCHMDHFDVLIVGAGPAGSFAAERIARGGARVALFDGRPPSEPKACGGGVTAKALRTWPHLLEAVGRTIDELDMYSPSGKHLHLKLDEPFAVYSRIAFDTFLRERARSAGARVFAEKIGGRGFKRSGEGWIVQTQSGKQFFTAWLVGADGANSAIAKKLAGPLPPAEMEVAFGYRAPLPKDGQAATVIAFLPKWVGYAWAFPRPDHISFGIATTQDAFDHEALDKLLWDFMVSYYDVGRVGNLRPSMHIWSKGKRGGIAEGARVNNLRQIRGELEISAERYAARIPGLEPRTWTTGTRAASNGRCSATPRVSQIRSPAKASTTHCAQQSCSPRLTGLARLWITNSVGEKILAANCSAPHK
jgi:choline dehydrogenase-like flavoprotein